MSNERRARDVIRGVLTEARLSGTARESALIAAALQDAGLIVPDTCTATATRWYENPEPCLFAPDHEGDHHSLHVRWPS